MRDSNWTRATTSAAYRMTQYQLGGEMKVGVLLKVLRDVVTKLEAMGLLLPNGDFVGPTPEQDAELAAFVEQQLVANGIPVPDKVVKVTGILPLILSMVQ